MLYCKKVLYLTLTSSFEEVVSYANTTGSTRIVFLFSLAVAKVHRCQDCGSLHLPCNFSVTVSAGRQSDWNFCRKVSLRIIQTLHF